jgi:3'-phosphoadenosine 5'-phosphosulfate sulfotransferase (PAPS reductase)/FAD synthetase
MKKNTIVVWFSCGAASAVAAKKTIEQFPNDNVLIVNNPVDEEHPDNIRFRNDVAAWLGKEIITAKNTKLGHTSAQKVWDDRKYMSGTKGAPCTVALKKEARYEFERAHAIDFHVLGFTADEVDRHERFVKGERTNVIPVLIDAGLTKGRCFEILQEAGIKLPEAYLLGYPNANCIGCVKSNSATYWNLVRKKNPEVFENRAEQSRRIGARLVRHKGVRLFLDELPADAVGGKLKSYECGIFCDTK